MQKIVILGAGGQAGQVWWVFYESNKVSGDWEILGFIDDNPQKHGRLLCDLPILGGFDWFKGVDVSQIKVISAVGSGQTRKAFAEKATELGLDFCTVVNPSAQVAPSVELGCGTVIAAGGIVNVHTKIGNHVNFNIDATIGHDVVIGDFCNVGPGCHITGEGTLEEGVDLGVGAVVLPRVTIGRWSVIGAGAVVTKDLPEYATAVGIPAKVIKVRHPEEAEH